MGMNPTINAMVEVSDFSKEEIEFLEASKTGQTDVINQTQIVANMVLMKAINSATQQISEMMQSYQETSRETQNIANRLQKLIMIFTAVIAVATVVGLFA